MALSHTFLFQEIQVGGTWERKNFLISGILFIFFFFKHKLFSSAGGNVIKVGCVTSAHLHGGDLFFCFLLKIFIRLAEYSLMRHLVLCKFLLMAGKNYFRAWYTLNSEKPSSRFLDWKLQLAVDENYSLPHPPYTVFVWDHSFGHPFPFACCCAHFWARNWDSPSVISAPWTNISGNQSFSEF